MKLSIIVPVYNREKYISECIDSILAQEFKDYELILVDDGSNDSSLSICRKYESLDPRIKVIAQANKGVSAARNAGLAIAQGKYLGFIDSDDTIPSNFYECMVGEAERNDADIVSCYMNTSIVYQSVQSGYKVLARDEFANHIFDIPPTIFVAVTNKIIKRELLHTTFQHKIGMCEDLLFLIEYCKNIHKAVITTETTYFLRQHNDSLTRKEEGKVVEGLSIRREAIEISRHISKRTVMMAERAFLDNCVRLIRELKRDRDEQYRSIAILELKQYFKLHPLAIAKNGTIPIKQKLIYTTVALTWLVKSK